MPRTQSAQLNIRSRFARERVALIASRTGMTATQVVEEALRAYQPPGSIEGTESLVKKFGLLVKPATAVPVTLAETNAAIEEERSERRC